MSLESTQRELLRQAAEWRLLSLLFECPSPAWRRDLEAIAPEIASAELRQAAASALTEATEGRYHSTFGPGGPAPAREASYRNTLQLGHLLAELEAYYQAFGFQPARKEPPDHVAMESAFVGYLRLKQAYALACGDSERAQLTEEAATRFLSEHLATFAAPLATALQSSDTTYLRLAGKALLERAGTSGAAASPLRVLSNDPDVEQALFECDG